MGCTKSRQKYFIVVRYFCFIWEGNQETVPLLHEKMRTSFLQDEGKRAKKNGSINSCKQVPGIENQMISTFLRTFQHSIALD